VIINFCYGFNLLLNNVSIVRVKNTKITKENSSSVSPSGEW